LAPPGISSGQQPLQPVHGLHPQVGQLVAAVGEQPQRDQLLVEGELAQPRGTQRHHRHRMRVGGVGLAGVAGVEDPDPGSQLGRHVDHGLALGQQPLRQWPADPVGALDRPPAVRPLLPDVLQHQPVAVAVGREPAPGQHPFLFVDRLDRHRLLVWVHTHDHPAHQIASSLEHLGSARTGRATSSRAIPS
jgi:hypothetical protein